MAFDLMERTLLDKFFNLSGFVMDFSTDSFDNFTKNSVGISIVQKYRLSKAKSLKLFFEEANDADALKLLSDLLSYYRNFYTTNSINSKDIEQMEKYYAQVKDVVQTYQEVKTNKMIESGREIILSRFDSTFVRNRIDSLEQEIETDSAGSIGSSKDLFESIMKMILDSRNVKYKNSKDKSDDIPALWKKVQVSLNLDPKNMFDNTTGNDSKKVLTSISQMVLGMNDLRNHFGTGHGKGEEFRQLPDRYGRLTGSITVAIAVFLVETMGHLDKNASTQNR